MAVISLSPPYVDEAESCEITATMYDMGSTPLDKAAIQTLTLTLQNVVDGSIINGRDEQDILDANGGTLDPDGTLTLILGVDDNVVVGSAQGIEYHLATISWTWENPQAVPLKGSQVYQLGILPKVEAGTPGGSGPGWIG